MKTLEDTKRLFKRRDNRRIYLKENIQMAIMCIPAIVLVYLFRYRPMPGILIAFKNFNPNKGIDGSEWCGLENFEFFFTSQDAAHVITNTVLYSIAFLILNIVTCVGLAILFYHLRSNKALKVYNTICITPRFMSMVIIAFVAYAILSPTYGFFNTVAKTFGIDPINFYAEAKYWPFILCYTYVWKGVGMGSVLYYASLMSMDQGLLEAAEIDGANVFHRIWHVMIPHLIPIIVIQTILAIGGLFNGDFGLFYQVPKDQGLLYKTTDIINTYTFRAMFDGAMDKSAAINLFQNVIGMILVLLTNGIVKKISPEHRLF